jgi:nitronate monooxygenase
LRHAHHIFRSSADPIGPSAHGRIANNVLAAAVFKAGGLGSIPAAMLSAEQLHAELTAFQMATAADSKFKNWRDFLPVNVNFFCHTPPAPQPDKESAWRIKLTSLISHTALIH